MKRIAGYLLLISLTALIAIDVDVVAQETNTQSSIQTATQPDWSAWNGTWQPAKAIFGGQDLPKQSLESMTLIMKNGLFEFQRPGMIEKGRLAITKPDSNARIGHVDVIIEEGLSKGKTVPAIYRFESGKLVICYAGDGQQRPGEFGSAANNQNLLIEYEQQN